MKVKNINGTRDNTCKCDSWLNHWIRFSGETRLPMFCSEKACTQKPEVGAHVQKDSSSDNSWYITALSSFSKMPNGELLT